MKEFPKAVSGFLLDVGTIRWGNWKVPDEMSVGQAGDEMGIDVAVVVEVLGVVEAALI